MFFVLSKLLDIALSPLGWTLFLVGGGLALRKRRPRLAVACGVLGLLVLVGFSLDPVANKLWRALETPPLSSARPGDRWDAVIVLSGLVDDAATEAFGRPAYNDNVERLLETFQLLRSDRARFVLISGGSGRLGGGPPEADVIAQQLEAWGIDRSRIVLERGSRNTHENAAASTAIVHDRGWRKVLLVTSAFHMPRALGCFRKEGLAVDTLAVDFRSNPGFGLPLPRATALGRSEEAIRELAGRVIYRLVGFSVDAP